MGGAQSKKTDGDDVEKEAAKQKEEERLSRISVLGVQGVGKSTCVKQFVSQLGSAELTGAESKSTKADILRAVVTRTKVILNHIIESLEDGETICAKELVHMYDELCEREDVGLRTEESAQRFCTASELFGPLVRAIHCTEGHALVKAVCNDNATLLKIQSSLTSGEKEQLFLSGNAFAHRIREVMKEDYKLTHDDNTQARSWTRDCQEHTLIHKMLPRPFQIRDVGGDEMNRHHWPVAIKESVCCLFVVSMSDYCKTVKGSNKSRFRETRSLMWELVDKAEGGDGAKNKMKMRPNKMILLLNKKDLFKTMLKKSTAYPLHTSCEVFRAVEPQAANESDDTYVARCEQEVIKYFTRVPSAMKQKYSHLSEAHQPKVFGPYLTCATDANMFGGVIKQICGVLLNITSGFVEDAGFGFN